jgi:polysaccharide export outer membrane protein
MRTIRRIIALGLMLLAIPGLTQDYILDTEDVLSVVIMRHPELNSEYEVPPSGLVTFHGAGEIQVRGLTLKQVELQIEKQMESRYKDPDVSVSLKSARPRWVFVTGEVKLPGRYAMQAGWRVAEAIAVAGGYTENAALTHAFISRKQEVIPVDLYRMLIQGDITLNVAVQPDDLIVVPTNLQRFAVMGQVNEPGFFPVPNGKPFYLADAIAVGGGPTKKAVTSKVYVLRIQNNEIEKMEVPYIKFLKQGDLTGNPLIRDGDVIVLSEAKRFEISEIFSAVQTLVLLRGIGWLK